MNKKISMYFYGLALCCSCLYLSGILVPMWASEGLQTIGFILLASTFCFIAAAWMQLRSAERLCLRLVFVSALSFRLITFFAGAPPENMLSNDIWRYLWEGRVVAAGYNPFVLEPEHPELAELAAKYHDIWRRVEHKEVPTIYPPLAQYLFAVIPPNPTALKAIFILFDLITVWTLMAWLQDRGQPPSRALLYAWLPLPILEIAGSGHLDAMVVCFMVLGLREFERHNRTRALILLMLAVLCKPVALVPLGVCSIRYLRSAPRRALQTFILILAVALVAYAPFLQDSLWIWEGSKQYAARWTFNASLYDIQLFVLNALGLKGADSFIKLGTAGILATLLLVLSLGDKRVSHVCSIVFVAVLLLSSTVYPWYLLWFAALIPMLESKSLQLAVLSFCLTSLLSYEVLFHPERWELSPWLRLLEYGPVYGLLSFHFLQTQYAQDSA